MDSSTNSPGGKVSPMSMGVGDPAPDFSLTVVESSGEDRRVQRADYLGQWLMLVFYPRDFSFVCPTELTAFSARMSDFRSCDCAVLGISIDTPATHRNWFTTPTSEGGIGPLQFPLASDEDGSVCQAYGTWNREKNVSNRGLFIIDPEGHIQYSVIHGLSVGRSADEVLRVLEALKTGGLCPSSWTTADGTLDVKAMVQPGRVLGHYRIERELGRGGFGSVLLAWDLRLERMVALKVLQQRQGQTRNAVLAEARLAAAVGHSNVCTVYAAEEIDSVPVIAMEFVSGEPLTRFIGQPFETTQFSKIAGGLAHGLAAAHDHNIVHGDLKPANVMVNEEGAAVIVDFGLAKTRAAEFHQLDVSDSIPEDWEDLEAESAADTISVTSSARLRETGDRTTTFANRNLAGTPAYMSPEQTLGKPPTPASDVYSLGLVMFEMLTGARAVRHKSLAGAIRALRDPELTQALTARVPEDYRPLLGTMLDHDPQQRCSARDVASALES